MSRSGGLAYSLFNDGAVPSATWETAMRLIFINQATGMIDGDSAEFMAREESGFTAQEAAEKLVRSIGENPYPVKYAVYRADVGGSDAVPNIIDGCDPELIADVKARCERLDDVTVSPARLVGREAIEYARRTGAALCKYADPTEDARDDLTVEEAEEAAAEDPSLVYVHRA